MKKRINRESQQALFMGYGDGSELSANTGGGLNNDALGKVIRINPLQSDDQSYSIPESNPFIGDSLYLDELYAVGFRNPHNLSFNKDSSGEIHLIVVDMGRDNFEEVNVVTAGGNYCWSQREGTFVHLQEGGGVIEGVDPLPENEVDFGFSYPAAQWMHNDTLGPEPVAQAITGGSVYEDPDNNIKHVIFGDFPVTGRMFYTEFADLLESVTSLSADDPERDESSELSQAQVYLYQIYFNHDNDPTTGVIKKNDMADIIDDEPTYDGFRADLRFGRDMNGIIYVSSKRNGWVYKVQQVIKDEDVVLSTNEIETETNANSLVVYPNPVYGDHFSIPLPTSFKELNTSAVVSLFSITGKLLQEEKVKLSALTKINLTPTIVNSTYFLKISTTKNT